MSDPMGYVLLVVALLFNASANILLKMGARELGGLDFKQMNIAELIPKLATNYFLIFGLTLFALNVVFYFGALSRVNLSIGYPIMTVGGLMIITIFSTLFLKESLTWLQYSGLFLIGLGIIFLASNAS